MMRRNIWLSLALMLLGSLLVSCSEPDSMLPSSVEITADSSAPLTEVKFVVNPPGDTPSNARLAILMLDTIAGLDIQTIQTEMDRRSDGRFETTLTVPVGSLLSYRYVRISPARADESTVSMQPISFRVAHVPGPTHIEETIAAWGDGSYEGTSGRIIGQILDQETGDGQRELLVSVGGKKVFTEAEGMFRVDGLPEGVHHLTAFSTDGHILPNAQGALIAGGSTTPVELRVEQAVPIFVTFQLTVPDGLSPDAIVRLAGNSSILGNRFGNLAGGTRVSVEHMPSLVRVDPQHFLAVVSLYAGMDLRYKYTLGDGLWNAERDAEGNYLSRQVILPAQDVVLRDTVEAWGNPGVEPVRFQVKVPDLTPDQDRISIQFNPHSWFEPLPMWPLGPNTWYYDLYGPLEQDLELRYRYCRNLQCGSADDADTAGSEAIGRLLLYQGDALVVNDEVVAWKWLDEAPAQTPITIEPIAFRPAFRTGVEYVSAYQPSWRNRLAEGFRHLRGLRADSIILPLEWTWDQQNPTPLLSLDPTRTPFQADLQGIYQASQEAELILILKVSPSSETLDVKTWWETARRDPMWWEHWFEEYRLFALSAAELAAELGIEVLILGGKWAAPALPDAVLPDGSPLSQPADVEGRWRRLIQEVRVIYPGQIGFELPLDVEIPTMPDFLDSVDTIVFHWQIPLTIPEDSDVGLVAQSVAALLDLLDLRTNRFNRPLWIDMEYASVQGGATACPPAPDGSCRSIQLFENGQEVDPDLQASYLEQSIAINAVFLAAHDHPTIRGLFVSGFNPAAVLWDKSSSVYQKPAEDVLRYWYPRLQGD